MRRKPLRERGADAARCAGDEDAAAQRGQVSGGHGATIPASLHASALERSVGQQPKRSTPEVLPAELVDETDGLAARVR